jgi:microcystin-dependent protein
MDAFVGEIRAFGFGFVPPNWLCCDGSELQIRVFTPLYAVIGVNYGGDGQNTFKLPNLNAVAPLHWGTPDARGGAGLDPMNIGDTFGTAGVALNSAQLGVHSHPFNGGTATAQGTSPAGALPGQPKAARVYNSFQTGTPSNAQLASQLIGATGSPTPAAHENRQPILTMYFCICTNGMFPVRSS